MKQSDLDNKIKVALSYEANQYGISDMELNNLKINIDREIKKHENKEKRTMKKMNIRRVVTAVVVAVMLTGTMCFAVGKIAYTVSSSSSILDYKEFVDISKVEAKIGTSIDTIEEFSNGYRFKGITIVNNVDCDEKGNKIRKYKSASVEYEKDGNTICLEIIPNKELSDLDKVKSEEIVSSESTIYYSKTINKFVPEGYELTKEEEEAIEKGILNVANGSEKIEIQESQSILWEKAGNIYMIFEMPASVDKETLVEMVKEIVEK